MGPLPEVFLVHKVSCLEGLCLMFPSALPDQQKKMKQIYVMMRHALQIPYILSQLAQIEKRFSSSPVILPVIFWSVVMREDDVILRGQMRGGRKWLGSLKTTVGTTTPPPNP